VTPALAVALESPEPTRQLPADRDHAGFCRRFHATTGLAAACATVHGLPPGFLDRPIFSPETIMAALPISARTRNTLGRYLAGSPDTSGPWTVGRLLTTVPRFGVWTLLDVLEKARPAAVAALVSDGEDLRAEVARVNAQRLTSTAHAPLLERALAVIADRLPATELEIRDRLQRGGFGAEPPDLRDLERAARRADRPPGFLVLRRAGAVIAVRADDFDRARALVALTKRLAAEWGPVNVDELLSRLTWERSKVARQVLSAVPSLRWLDRSRRWVWLPSARGRFLRRVATLLEVRSPRPIAELAEAAVRGSGVGRLPPTDVLAAALALVERFDVREGQVRLARGDCPTTARVCAGLCGARNAGKVGIPHDER
jgi:hypothetical protein